MKDQVFVIWVNGISIISLIIEKQGSSEILHEICEIFILTQLMATVGNVNHVVNIVAYWIFDSNYKNTLMLTLYSFNIICSPLVVEELFSMFETVLTQLDTSTTEGN